MPSRFDPAPAPCLVRKSDLATALMRSGRRDAALQAAQNGLARDAFDIAALRVAGTTLLDSGRAQEAYDLAQSLVAPRRASRAGGVDSRGGSAALGRDGEFQDLTAQTPWFTAERLDLDNDALAREILTHDTLIAAQAYKPIRGRVLRIDDFDAIATPAVAAFHQAVRDAVSRYCKARGDRMEHPLIAGWPKRMQLSSWALAMHGDGFEDWHIHAGAWLSGVYYVRNPGGDGDAGRIGFGALPAMAKTAGAAIPQWTVAPEPGLLILFPSWYAHRTWPTGAAQERISIAFDAIPA